MPTDTGLSLRSCSTSSPRRSSHSTSSQNLLDNIFVRKDRRVYPGRGESAFGKNQKIRLESASGLTHSETVRFVERLLRFVTAGTSAVNVPVFCRYEQLLLEQDPLPSYGLKLLLALLEQNSSFIKCVQSSELV